jgi:hypothetical protein
MMDKKLKALKIKFSGLFFITFFSYLKKPKAKSQKPTVVSSW